MDRYVCNYVKLEICSFVMNFNSRAFSIRVMYFMGDTGYGLCRSKYQMVKTQTESHVRRLTHSLNKPMADLGFLFL